MITELDILWGVIILTPGLVAVGLTALLVPIGAERLRRREDAVDRDLEARRAQFAPGAMDAAVESAMTGGRISPATIQRFIDRGWLDPR